MLTEEKLDWKCSTCRRKFRGKCNAGSHIAQSSCKRKSATVEFIGAKNEPPKNIMFISKTRNSRVDKYTSTSHKSISSRSDERLDRIQHK